MCHWICCDLILTIHMDPDFPVWYIYYLQHEQQEKNRKQPKSCECVSWIWSCDIERPASSSMMTNWFTWKKNSDEREKKLKKPAGFSAVGVEELDISCIKGKQFLLRTSLVIWDTSIYRAENLRKMESWPLFCYLFSNKYNRRFRDF